MDLEDIKQTVQSDIEELDKFIQQNLYSDISLINDIVAHVIQNAGKRIRPLIVLLSATACGNNDTSKLFIAATLEFIHTATLLHDDVVDNSKLRRGLDTANSVWGNAKTILVGDFLYSRSFQLMAKVNSLEIFNLIANTTNKMAEGEVVQLENKFSIFTNESDYLKIIENKTALLFSACSKAGAILASQDEMISSALANYGLHLGMAFQLIDDALDYDTTKTKLGKNIGDDLAEGKATLPLIYALKRVDSYDKQIIINSIKTGNLENLEKIQEIISKTSALEYTKKCAKEEIEKAKTSLTILPESKYKTALANLADFVVAREY